MIDFRDRLLRGKRIRKNDMSVHLRPGGDLLSRGLSQSTIGAEGFHFRVRDGIGWIFLRHDHQVVDEQISQ